jgi:hypothetical protein
MKPKVKVILEDAIDLGIEKGYRRAFKHTDIPSEDTIKQYIEEAIWGKLYEYFDFENV